MELEHAGRHSNGLYAWDLVDGDFAPRYRSVADWIETICDVLEEGAFSVHRMDTEHGPQEVASLDWERERARARVRLQAGPADQRATIIPRDASEWPEHWRAAPDAHP